MIFALMPLVSLLKITKLVYNSGRKYARKYVRKIEVPNHGL